MNERTTPDEQEMERLRLDAFARTKWEVLVRRHEKARLFFDEANVESDWTIFADFDSRGKLEEILETDLSGVMCAIIPRKTEDNITSIEAATLYTEPLNPQGRPEGGRHWAGKSVLRLIKGTGDIDKS